MDHTYGCAEYNVSSVEVNSPGQSGSGRTVRGCARRVLVMVTKPWWIMATLATAYRNALVTSGQQAFGVRNECLKAQSSKQVHGAFQAQSPFFVETFCLLH